MNTLRKRKYTRIVVQLGIKTRVENVTTTSVYEPKPCLTHEKVMAWVSMGKAIKLWKELHTHIKEQLERIIRR